MDDTITARCQLAETHVHRFHYDISKPKHIEDRGWGLPMPEITILPARSIIKESAVPMKSLASDRVQGKCLHAGLLQPACQPLVLRVKQEWHSSSLQTHTTCQSWEEVGLHRDVGTLNCLP